MARIPEWIEYFAGIAMGLEGESNVIKGGYVTMTHYEPLGPSGFAYSLEPSDPYSSQENGGCTGCWKYLCNQTVELAPVSPLVIAVLASEAGLPDGAVNVVTGGPKTGAVLCAADDIHYIDLTGGTSTGRKVAAKAGERLIRSTMELGGKTPIIVCEDADLEGAVAGTLLLPLWRRDRPVSLELGSLCMLPFMTTFLMLLLRAQTPSKLETQWPTAPKWDQ